MMAYILENKETGKYLIATGALTISFTETNNRNKATIYPTSEEAQRGILAAAYFARINAKSIELDVDG